MNADPSRLARTLGYSFSRPELLEQALTHRSAGSVNNERLEFLGDAVLGFVIAAALLERFSVADEGVLSRMRASLVKRESLARLARGLQLGNYLRLGTGELRTGGHARDSILADALEAVLGAIYLDSGFAATQAAVMALFAERLDETSAAQSGKDPKTCLQEWLQSRKRPLPEYVVAAIDGDQHDQTFIVNCRLSDADLQTVGDGSSRRRAEQSAARAMLEKIEHD